MIKKRVLKLAVFGVAVFALFQFIYLPKLIQVNRLSREYNNRRSDIEEVYSFAGGKDALNENITKLRQLASDLQAALPFEHDVSNIIKELNKEARLFMVDVISIKPRNLEVYRDSGGAEIKAGDYFCKSLPMSLVVESRYQALGEFIEKIEKDRSPFVSVKEVSMRNDQGIAPKIRSEIRLNACMLGK